MAGQEGGEAPEPAYRKTLRAMDPDLTIICRYGDGENVKERTFQCHSAFFAMNSSYFDALLSSEMEEAASKQVTLEDVDPDTFDQAMTLLEKLDHSPTKLEDLLKVARIYNRFQFEKGIEYVQSRVSAFLENIYGQTVEDPSIFETVIDCALVADEASIQEETISMAEDILAEQLDDDLLHGRAFFTLGQLQRLQPFLVARPQLVGDILDQRAFPGFQRPDANSSDLPIFLHSLFTESSNCQMIQNSGLEARIHFRISVSGEHLRDYEYVKGEGHELMTGLSAPLYLYSKHVNEVAERRLKYSVRVCRFGNRAFERQCQHKDLDDSDWCMQVTVSEDVQPYTERYFLAFLPHSKGHLIPPSNTHGWISLGLVDHYDQHGSQVEPLEAADSFLLSVDRFEHVWGGRAA